MFRILELGKWDAYFSDNGFLIGKVVKIKENEQEFFHKKEDGFCGGFFILQEDIPEFGYRKGDEISLAYVKLEKYGEVEDNFLKGRSGECLRTSHRIDGKTHIVE